jgi:hypothetical protein
MFCHENSIRPENLHTAKKNEKTNKQRKGRVNLGAILHKSVDNGQPVRNCLTKKEYLCLCKILDV